MKKTALTLLALGLTAAPSWLTARTAEEILAARQKIAQNMELLSYRTISNVRRAKGQAANENREVLESLDLRLSLLRPEKTDKGSLCPAIVFFHGGGFRSGSPDQFFEHCAYFSQRGFVAISAEYRLKNQYKVSIAEQLEDARAAIRWVRTRAGQLGVDPKQVIASGGSAGGYLALAAALVPDPKESAAAVSSMPNALALYNPLIEFDLYVERNGLDFMKASLGGDVKFYSATRQVRPGLPAMILFQGTEDGKTPYPVAVRFERAMKKAGNKIELVPFEGLSHGFHNRDPYLGQCLEKTREFLQLYGFAIQ